MTFYEVTFYVLAVVALLSAILVITCRNPVHSAIFLVLTLLSVALIFLQLQAEFMAAVQIIVYIGGIMVLFLFVVMMLDINFVEMRQGFLQYLPIGGLIGVILLIELLFIFASWTVTPDAGTVAAAPMPDLGEISNTRALGRLLYTKYIYFFQAAGLVLLVAMIGAIVLTLRTRKGVRRQKVPDQLRRTRAESVEIKKVETGKGI